MTPEELLGTRLRHVLETMDGAVAEVYRDLGLPGFRPRGQTRTQQTYRARALD